MKNSVTVRDIAKKLDISPSSVSRALNNNPRISESTKKKVWLVAKELGYFIKKQTFFDASNYNNDILVIFPEYSDYFRQCTLNGIKTIARQNNYNVLISYISDFELDEQYLFNSVLKIKPVGIIISLSPFTKHFTLINKILKENIPVVSFNNINLNLPIPKIIFDFYHASYTATNHLISVGCNRIAQLTGKENNPVTKENINAYETALKDNKFIPNNDFIIYSDLTYNDIETSLNYLFNLPQYPDGIITDNNYAALQIISYFTKNKVKVPEDVAVISLGFEKFNKYISPSISTVQFPAYKIGADTMKTLLKEIKNTKSGVKQRNISKIKSAQLIIRSSSMRN